MNNEPLVTVIIPCYNHENYIKDCIRSVINQTYENIELIVLNDGSKDRSNEKILEISDKCSQRFIRFEYINKENEGVSKTLNTGIKWAKGEYISPLSSDDLIMPDKIEKLIFRFENCDKKVGMICGDAIFIDDNSDKFKMLRKYDSFLNFSLCNRKKEKEKLLNEMEVTYLMMLNGNFLPGMAALYKKECLLKINGYNEKFHLEDWEIYLKILRKYKILYFNDVLAQYRWHETNSIKVISSKLVMDQIKIILDEKRYCFENEYKKEWYEIYNKCLLDVIYIKDYKKFFILFCKSSKLKFFKYLIKKYIFNKER